ncbi:MAG: YjbH domain-containing protein [Burkholderiales bacterium]|nr:YjbH domain-containing protein [Burkholderiales bacterium]
MTVARLEPGRWRRAKICFVLGLSLCALANAGARAEGLGVSSQGVTGGLVIPSADVLPLGTMAFTYGNYQEPQLGANSTRQNLSYGVGLLNHVELFGRYANYLEPKTGLFIRGGASDISANVKLELPTPWRTGPKLALGFNDFVGRSRAVFTSNYLVATDHYGPWDITVGYASGTPPAGVRNSPPTFDGAFSGVQWRLGDTGLSALAEYDGRQKHAGLRWHTPPLAALGQAELVASLHRSFDASTPTGVSANASNFALSLVIPLGVDRAKTAACEPEQLQELPALDAQPDPHALQPTPEDRLASLRQALVAAGLERVRVGLREGAWGTSVVVEYENHRYAQNEVDALGLVFGLGAEMSPPGTQRVHAVTFKEGLRLYETSVGVTAYRQFLRGGPAGYVTNSLIWDRVRPDLAAQTRWIDAVPAAFSRVRVEIKPDLAYFIGTEVGPNDYALAANVQAIAPLWSGARLYASYLVPLANSSNMDDGGVFASSRQEQGLKTAAVQQSFWWWDRRVLANVSAGRFYYDTLGVQGEAAVFVPGSDDWLRLRGAAYKDAPGGICGQDRAYAASYRHMFTPTMWLEAGAQRYSDGSNGPSVEWTRWFGDVGVGLFYQKGGDNQFVGLQLSFPLTPRRGMAPGPVILTGPSQYVQPIRTRLSSGGGQGNALQPGAALDLKLDTSLSLDLLNAGRLSQAYFTGQVYRMREAFFLYKPDLDQRGP